MIWVAIITASVGCYLLKLAGLSLPQSLLDRPDVQRVAALLPVALLAALVAVGTFADGRRHHGNPAGGDLAARRSAAVEAASLAHSLPGPAAVACIVVCDPQPEP
jgi:hypothetical protein